MQIINVIVIILEVVILFNFIIIVHELGHYLAARWRGLQVDKFQIWFGKPLWKKKINGVQWGLGCIPAGGFVALPQMAPMEMLEGSSEHKKLPPIKPLDKIIVALAGPVFSFGLAVLFAVIVWGVGHPVSKQETTRTIGYISDSAAPGSENLRRGDEVLEVDNRPVTRWEGMVDSVRWNVVSSSGEYIPFKVNRPGEGEVEVNIKAQIEERDQELKWYQRFFKRDNLRQVGIQPEFKPMVARVYKNSPADVAGVKANDVVVAIDNEEVFHSTQIGEWINKNPGKAAPITVAREENGQTVKHQFEITPRVPDNFKAEENGRKLMGILWDSMGVTELSHPSPGSQISQTVRTMVNTLSSVFSPKSDIGPQHLSGPVMIMRIYYLIFEDEDGWRRALWFSVLLNVNLAILNLLPLPVLDGGHIMMALFEWVRKRPISVRFLEVVNTASALLLFGFMIYVTGFDLGDIFGGGGSGGSGPKEPVFEPVSTQQN